MLQVDGPPAPWRRWLYWLQRCFFLLAITSIGTYLALHWHPVSSLIGRANPALLLAALLGLALLHPVLAFAYWRIQRSLGIERGYGRNLASYAARLPARFIPGGVWHSVARYADIRGDDHSSMRGIGRLFIAEVIATATGGCLVSAFALIAMNMPGPARLVAWIMLLAGVAGSLAPLFWTSLERRRNDVLNWFVSIAAIGGAWCGYGAMFALIAAALGGPFAQCPAVGLATTYTTAATAGNIAIFSPQGWGVTDAIFAWLRPCPIPIADLLSAILALRLISIAADLCTWTIGLAWLRRDRA